MIQGTEEWRISKLGNVGASRIADIMATTKSGVSASRKNYMAQLLIERLTGESQDNYTSPDMQWGIDHEDEARAAYEAKTFNNVELCGFIMTPDGLRSGASPDGLVGDDGLLEIKCPKTATHLDTLLSGKIERKYILQMQWQMYVTGRKWCDFVSYDPRLPENLRIFINQVVRDEPLLLSIYNEVAAFLEELDAMEKKLREVRP